MVTVCAGILSENPALSKAYCTRNNWKIFELGFNTSRAIFDVFTSWITVPITQYSGADLSIFVRLTRPLDKWNFSLKSFKQWKTTYRSACRAKW
jgi:hypothetical protein